MLIDKLRYLSKGADVVVLAGSLPRDVPSDFYATVVRELRRHELVTALDAAGPPLRAGLAAEPTIVSPNRREAEEIVGHEFQDEADLAEAGRSLLAMGAGNALLHDEDGCVARAARRQARRAPSGRACRALEVISTVGSGDAFLAGYLAGWYAQGAGRDGAAARRGLRRGQHPDPRRGGVRPGRRRGVRPPGGGRGAGVRGGPHGAGFHACNARCAARTGLATVRPRRVTTPPPHRDAKPRPGISPPGFFRSPRRVDAEGG